jgi:hydrogenase maturation protein HypF
MARDLETVQSFAKVNRREAELLTSHVRPIVLLNKSDRYYLSKLIAPELHNIGVMLPYTGLHYLLFDDVREPAFVMTSANPPNEPIVTNNDEAIKKLGKTVDYLLFHNRLIAQRCDDSVVRVHGQNINLVRRSRGYAPEPIQLKWSSKANVLGLGGELNVTSCILTKNQAFLSQHIGDVENLETFQFLKNAIRHLMHLTNTTKVETVACDLHPKFTTTKLAQEIGEECNCPVVTVQHHYAHAAALIAEMNIDEIVAIVCDGYGYGLDGSAWGGEVLYCNREGEFKRLGHLQPQLMIGSDLATRYPMRMAAGILGKTAEVANVERWLLDHQNHLPYGKNEVEIILQQMKDRAVLQTTSCGRILDAVAAILGICYERTYEGEPAMKLESAALAGKDVLKSKPLIQNDVIDTTGLVSEIFKNRNKLSVADLAFSTQSYLALSLAQLAVEKAQDLGVDVIGFSGGVACNEHITTVMRKVVEANEFKFVVHRLLPPGDGGVSFGQAVTAALQMK